MNKCLTAMGLGLVLAAGSAFAQIPLPPPPQQVVAEIKQDIKSVVTGRPHSHAHGKGHRNKATHSHWCAKKNRAGRCTRWVHR